MDMGSLTCEPLWLRVVHTKGTQAQTSLLNMVDSDGQKKMHPTLHTARGSNPGSSDLNSDVLCTELHVSDVASLVLFLCGRLLS